MEPSCISTRAESIANTNVYEEFTTSKSDENIENLIKTGYELSETYDSATFIQKFKKLSPTFQKILVFIFVDIIIS